MKLSKILTPLLLTFALLMTQSGGFAHSLGHALSEQSQDQSLAQDQLCDLCAAYAQISTAIQSASLDFALSHAVCDQTPSSQTHAYSIPLIAFAARAPPSL